MSGEPRHVRRVVERDRRHDPGDVTDIVGAAARRLGGRAANSGNLRRQTARPAPHLELDRLREGDVVLAPFGQADRLDVFADQLRDRPAEVAWSGLAEHPVRDRRVGHQRGPLGDPLERLEVRRDAVELDLPDEVPDRRLRGDHVRLVAAVGDDVVRALKRVHVLAMVVPADVHQLDGVERAPAAPGRARAVRGFPAEGELDRDHSGSRTRPPANAEVASHVGEDHRVDVVEVPLTDEPCLAAQLLFRDARPERDRAGDVLAAHHLLERDRGDDVDRLAGIVAFTVARRVRDEGVVVGDPGLLVGFGDPVDVTAEGDRRPAGPVRPGGPP